MLMESQSRKLSRRSHQKEDKSFWLMQISHSLYYSSRKPGSNLNLVCLYLVVYALLHLNGQCKNTMKISVYRIHSHKGQVNVKKNED